MTTPLLIEDLCFEHPTKKFTKTTKIRGGHLWSIVSEKTLVYANLNKTPIKFIDVPDLTSVMFIFVSPDGKYCVVRSADKKQFILYDYNLNRKFIQCYSNKVFRSVAFGRGQQGKPTIWFGCDGGTIGWVLADNPTQFNIFAVDNTDAVVGSSANVVGLAIKPQQNNEGKDDHFSLAILAEKQQSDKALHAYQLDYQYFPLKTQNSINHLGNIQIGEKGYQIDDHLIAAVDTQRNLYYYELNDLFEKNKVYSDTQIFFQIPEFDTFNICDDIIFLFLQGKNGETTVTIEQIRGSELEFIEKVKIPEYQTVEVDNNQKSIYLIDGSKIRRLIFNSNIPEKSGIIGFSLFCYNRFIQQNNYEAAIKALISSKMPFNTMSNITKSNPLLYHKLLVSLVDSLPDTKKRVKMALALRALEVYVRLETSGTEKLEPPFYDWVEDQIRKRNLSQEAVREVLDTYGWNEPYDIIIKDKSALIDHELSFGSTDKAAKLLAEEKNNEEFTNSAVRIFNIKPDDVISALYARPNISQREFAPIVSSPQGIERVYELINGKLKSSWLRAAFVLQMAKDAKRKREEIQNKIKDEKDPDKIEELNNSLHELQAQNIQLADKFFRDQSNPLTSEDCDIAYRAFFYANEPSLVAIGLKSQNRYAEAAVADPDQAIHMINEAKNPSEKMRTTIGVLRSMEPKKAGDFAQRLLSVEGVGIEAAKLIDFLPDTVCVSELENAVDKYIEKNTKAMQDQKKMFDEAKDGIERAHSLMTAKQDPNLSLSSMESCSCCGKLLFTGEGVVFPCKHGFHIDCINSMFQKLNIKNTEVTKNCPVCSFISASMISAPFSPSIESSQRWSTNVAKLKLELEAEKKQSLINIPQFKKVTETTK